MPKGTRMFRIFISSTFDDLKAERDALQKKVFPDLRDFCSDNGFRFQAIDLRWGVRDEATLDQRTMKICLDELARCQKTTIRPNFIVLLGDRYGWQPLPIEIDALEFEKFRQLVDDGYEKELLDQWYEKDDNNLPPVYYLRPRRLDIPEGATPEEIERIREEEKQVWGGLETKVHSMLLKAAQQIDLPPEKTFKYMASATEQEIQNGAFSLPDAAEHVFTFFRKINGLPENESAGFYRDLDSEGKPDPRACEMLENLKGRLRKKLPKGNVFQYQAEWTGYSEIDRGDLGEVEEPPITTDHLEKLCADVYDSLSRVIEVEMKRLEVTGELEEELAEHESPGAKRVLTGWISTVEAMDSYLRGDSRNPFAVFAERGTGKSSLLGKAIEQAQKSLYGAVVLSRFIGTTPSSSDVRSLLESLCLQITRAYGKDEDAVPSSYEELVHEFPQRLGLASAERPLILFLDSLENLSEDYDALSLTWLPNYLPEHVRLVLSTCPGKVLVALRRKEAGVKELTETWGDPRGELDLWLKDAGRTLQPHQRENIELRLGESWSPLYVKYLKLVLEEATLWRSSSPLVTIAPDIEGIISDLYDRLSEDSNHGSMLVERTLGYLSSSHHGLSEDELLGVLSADTELYGDFIKRSKHKPPEPRLPDAVFSRLFYDLKPYLTEWTVGGISLIHFYHRELAEVTKKRYLAGDIGIEHHLALADYFSTQRLGPRKVAELPWQLYHAEDWKSLYTLLSDPPFFSATWEADQFQVKDYWSQLEDHSVLRMVDAYRSVLDNPDEYQEHIWDLATLFHDTGHPEEALLLRGYLVECYRKTEDKDKLVTSFGNQALILSYRGDMAGAMKLHNEEERICRELGDRDGLQRSLGNQAAILSTRGDLDGAMKLHKEEGRICRELGRPESLARSLFNQAVVRSKQGLRSEALPLAEEAYELAHRYGCTALDQRIRPILDSLYLFPAVVPE